ncbi:MAG: exodeoxyribonuclease III [Azospirillaceae bacterium]|nr:exodeoxyribonuclease III [Azospirillaceae bacterium]
MRIVTWNINSVRLRLDMVLRLVDDYGPDVLCLQETKVIDDAFPLKALAERGYVHAHVRGMKSYNGVAILSRLPLSGTGGTLWCERQDCRHVQAELPGGIELHNFYIPAGGDIPDPDLNDKFRHKLRFLDELAAWGEGLEDRRKPRILLGDLNIAPLENDVWSHRQLLNVISHTPIEVEKMEAMRRAGDWVDAVRHFLPPSEKLYTWWSYRSADWGLSDRGRRLDHIWVTPPLVPHLLGYTVLREARGWGPKPSDHVPVIIDLDL